MNRDDDIDRAVDSSLPDYVSGSIALLSALWPGAVLFGVPVALGIARVRARRLGEFRDRVHALLMECRADLDALRARVEADEAWIELLERGAEEAARTASDDRRRYIAELIARGLTTKEWSADQGRKLLNTLGDLADVEVLLLIHFSHELALGEKSEFFARHESVLSPILFASEEIGSSREEQERRGLRDGYMAHLQALGLLVKIGRDPYMVTPFGRVLLRFIGAEKEHHHDG